MYDIDWRVKQHHFDRVADNMRGVDVAECYLATGMRARRALALSLFDAKRSAAGLVNGDAFMIFGVRDMGDRVGRPWMVGTDEIEENARAFAALTKSVVIMLSSGFIRLENYVHAENDTAKLWLRRIGFTVGRPQPYGPKDALFCPFWMEV